MNKKMALLPVIAIAVIGVALASAAFAQNNDTQSTEPLLDNTLIGKGLAVSTSDSTVFRPVGIGIAVSNQNNQTTMLGRLRFDSEKLQLTNIVVNNSSKVTADIQRNGTTVGSLSLAPTAETGHWTGSLTLDGKTYSVYILSMPKGIGKGIEHQGKMMEQMLNNGHGHGHGHGLEDND